MRRVPAVYPAALAAFFTVPCGARAAAPDDCFVLPAAPLTLAAADARVAVCNRDVAAARVALDVANADVRIAGQGPNPNLTLGVSNVNPSAGIGSGGLRDKTIDSSARLEQLVERGDKPRLRREQADALLAAARSDVAEQLRVQRATMRAAFFDLAAAQEKARLLGDFRVIAAQSAEAARRRLDQGEISRAEADRFRLDAARAANDERQAASDLNRARLDFARLLGAEAYAASIAVVPEWPAAALGSAPAGERPDVRAAEYRLQAAERASDLARSLATRDLTVGVQADHWPTSSTNLQGTGVSYSLNVEIPLYVRHANEGEAQRAQADLEAARAALDRVRASASADARIAEEEWRAADERREREDAEVAPAARDVAKGAEYAYQRGATGVLDLLDARRSLKTVELDEVQVRADAAKAWARREAARETLAD
jgi:cobalt-zinc-cadmium efflux system outer membrane protein